MLSFIYGVQAFSLLLPFVDHKLFAKLQQLNFNITIFLYHLGCENLKETLVKAGNGLNSTDPVDLCICTDDIYSKTDVWQEVINLFRKPVFLVVEYSSEAVKVLKSFLISLGASTPLDATNIRFVYNSWRSWKRHDIDHDGNSG